jgi:hypothetical protein
VVAFFQIVLVGTIESSLLAPLDMFGVRHVSYEERSIFAFPNP